MFEVQAYIGNYRKGGFTSYAEAAEHARQMVAETGQPHRVYEMVLRCMFTVDSLKPRG